MSLDVKVPKISEEEKSGVIIRWYRSEGDQVKDGEEICEVMIEKATLRVTAPSTGTLRIVKKDYDEIKEGEVIGSIEN